jgi:hypothetical protein
MKGTCDVQHLVYVIATPRLDGQMPSAVKVWDERFYPLKEDAVEALQRLDPEMRQYACIFEATLELTKQEISDDKDCEVCGASARQLACAVCGSSARMTNCGHLAQPRPIAADETGQALCESCSADLQRGNNMSKIWYPKTLQLSLAKRPLPQTAAEIEATYDMVATSDLADPDSIFEQFQEPGRNLRSMSVGDILQIGDVFLRCEGLGWTMFAAGEDGKLREPVSADEAAEWKAAVASVKP